MIFCLMLLKDKMIYNNQHWWACEKWAQLFDNDDVTWFNFSERQFSIYIFKILKLYIFFDWAISFLQIFIKK